MTQNPGRRIDNMEIRIDEAVGIDEDDQEALRELNKELALRRSTYGQQRREKVLRINLRIAEEVGGIADALDDRDAAENVVRWIHDNYENENSNSDYRGAFRVFGKLVGEDDEIPDSISWISSTTSKDYDPKPDPGKMLRWEEHVLPMLDECTNARDKALIAVSWDSGARSGEIRELTVGDVSDGKHGMQISVDGKTGQRSVTLFVSTPYLKQWLNVHPAPEDRNAPLWSKLSKPEDPSYILKLGVLKDAAQDAGITHTDVTLTRMRKSSASFLASKGVSQAVLEDRFGWKRGSDAASHYITVFDESTDRAVAKTHGIDVEEHAF